MANKILLISNNIDINKLFLKKIMLLRTKDNIASVSYADYKSYTNIKKNIIIINSIDITHSEVLKCIQYFSQNYSDSKIIILLDQVNSDLLFKYYDNGIYDYFSINDENYAITLKIMNGLKLLAVEETCEREQEYLAGCGAIDSKTGLYNQTYLKTIYPVLIADKGYQNGVFVILTLDESIKTKISSNRLALLIKKSIRKNDIAIADKGGYFYLILQNITIEDTSNIINKLQNMITEEFPIKAGIVKTGIRNLEDLIKEAKASLNSAIIHNQAVMSLSAIDDSWLEDDEEEKTSRKQYKLFKNLYENKIKYVIEPVFFKTQKELSKKLKSANINQYTNTIESSFCIKSPEVQSELIIRFNGYSKLEITITHSGLESADNSKYTQPLNKFNEKELNKYIKQLKEEHIQAYYQGEKVSAEQ